MKNAEEVVEHLLELARAMATSVGLIDHRAQHVANIVKRVLQLRARPLDSIGAASELLEDYAELADDFLHYLAREQLLAAKRPRPS